MMPINTINECNFEAVELFDDCVPALICDDRLADGDLDSEYEIFQLRGSDDDPGEPATLEKSVRVNYCGSIVVLRSADISSRFGNKDYIDIQDDINYGAEFDSLGSKLNYSEEEVCWIYN